MKTITKCTRGWVLIIIVLALGGLAVPAGAQVTPPDLGVCSGVSCANLPEALCSDGGFKISLKSFTDASQSSSGEATYVYEICSPAAGACSIGGGSCLDNDACELNCTGAGKCAGTTQACTTAADCKGTCNRECVVQNFRGLSHFDITFPEIGGVGSCIGPNTVVTGSCEATAGSSVGNFVLGDGSCFPGGTSQSFVAKCDSTTLAAGGCITMTVNIPGELNAPGVGQAVVVDKASNTCTASCVAGPSCTPCEPLPSDGAACLTRTLGFWGTHPHIAMQYDPVTVCGKVINGQTANTCSTSEALCTSAKDYKSNPPYLALVAQLTAAKLNLNATAALLGGASCSSWTYLGQTINQWLAACDTGSICDGNKKAISDSGCIEALDAFNNSQDTGFDVTPSPFDRPGPAQVNYCQAARGNGKAIGINLCPPT